MSFKSKWVAFWVFERTGPEFLSVIALYVFFEIMFNLLCARQEILCIGVKSEQAAA